MKSLFAILCLGVFASSFAAEAPLACRTSRTVPLKFLPPAQDLATGNLPIPDYLDMLVACRKGVMPGIVAAPSEPPPVSAWLASERSRYAAVLARQPADVLVVPFQIQGYGLDRIERAVMTADLAYAIGDAGSLRVADPFLASLALGEGERRIDETAVRRLAEKIGARKVLFGYVGHDRNHAFTLTLKLLDTKATAASKSWQRDWRSVSFTDEQTPAYVLHEMLPAVLRELPLGLKVTAAVGAPVTTVPTKITGSPQQLVSSAAKSGSGVATMSLLAATLPTSAERTRERLFERALVAALRSGTNKPSGRFFEAHALFNLDRRPTALARIAGADGPSFDALRALLNGDLPGAQSVTQKVTHPFEQLLLQIALRDLEYAYDKDEQTEPTAAAQLFSESAVPTWAPLLIARFEDRNPWSVPDPVTIKRALDDAFPVKGLDVETVARGTSVALGKEVDEVDFDLANARHVRQVVEQLDVRACCRTRDLQPDRWDLIWLLQGLGEERISRELQMKVMKQALPESALAALARYEPMFSGHPALTAWSAKAAVRMAEKSPDDSRATWSQRVRRDGSAALQWSPGQNAIAYAAALAMGIPSGEGELWVDVYGYDYPRRPEWPMWFLGSEDSSADAQQRAFELEAYAFSTDNTDVFSMMSMEAQSAALATLGSRFNGHPRRPVARYVYKPSTPESRLAAAQAAAKEDAESNLRLGYELLYSGRAYKEAQDAFLAFPAFRTGKSRDRVDLSNEAYDVGSLFFWQGQGDLSKPLFRLAADLRTGSDASMGSEQRVLLLSGDYHGAAEVAQRRVARYGSSFAHRDYLSLLHAFGEHETAWSGFSQIRAALDEPAAWTSALVGHRMQGLDERALRTWLRTPEIRGAKFKAQLFASYYALLWSSTDRVPPADLGALVEELEGKPVAFIDSSGGVGRPHPMDPKGLELVRRSFKPEGEGKAPSIPRGTPVKSERAYFADAYSAVVRGEYAKAVERFTAMAHLYSVNGAATPYIAYAASKAGDTLKFEEYVTSTNPDLNPRFDELLAKAFFAAGRQNVDEAYRFLILAFRAKPYSGSRPVSVDYQFAQACEWLYRDTKDPRFAATVLEWAKNYQSVQPTVAWAYGVEYNYEKNPDARIRALAMTLYLDPSSDRIRSASKAEKKRAKAWLAANNPFLSKKKPAEGDMRNTSAALIAR